MSGRGDPRERRADPEEGTVLILALAFLTLFALVVGTILGLAATNLRTTAVVRGRAAATYTADGAVDAAVNAIRAKPSVGAAGTSSTCFSLPAGSLNSYPRVDVTCTGLGSAGGPTTTPRDVVFTASVGGADLLRAEVTFADASGTANGTIPKVLTWSLQ